MALRVALAFFFVVALVVAPAAAGQCYVRYSVCPLQPTLSNTTQSQRLDAKSACKALAELSHTACGARAHQPVAVGWRKPQKLVDQYPPSRGCFASYVDEPRNVRRTGAVGVDVVTGGEIELASQLVGGTALGYSRSDGWQLSPRQAYGVGCGKNRVRKALGTISRLERSSVPLLDCVGAAHDAVYDACKLDDERPDELDPSEPVVVAGDDHDVKRVDGCGELVSVWHDGDVLLFPGRRCELVPEPATSVHAYTRSVSSSRVEPLTSMVARARVEAAARLAEHDALVAAASDGSVEPMTAAERALVEYDELVSRSDKSWPAWPAAAVAVHARSRAAMEALEHTISVPGARARDPVRVLRRLEPRVQMMESFETLFLRWHGHALSSTVFLDLDGDPTTGYRSSTRAAAGDAATDAAAVDGPGAEVLVSRACVFRYTGSRRNLRDWSWTTVWCANQATSDEAAELAAAEGVDALADAEDALDDDDAQAAFVDGAVRDDDVQMLSDHSRELGDAEYGRHLLHELHVPKRVLVEAMRGEPLGACADTPDAAAGAAQSSSAPLGFKRTRDGGCDAGRGRVIGIAFGNTISDDYHREFPSYSVPAYGTLSSSLSAGADGAPRDFVATTTGDVASMPSLFVDAASSSVHMLFRMLPLSPATPALSASSDDEYPAAPASAAADSASCWVDIDQCPKESGVANTIQPLDELLARTNWLGELVDNDDASAADLDAAAAEFNEQSESCLALAQRLFELCKADKGKAVTMMWFDAPSARYRSGADTALRTAGGYDALPSARQRARHFYPSAVHSDDGRGCVVTVSKCPNDSALARRSPFRDPDEAALGLRTSRAACLARATHWYELCQGSLTRERTADDSLPHFVAVEHALSGATASHPEWPSTLRTTTVGEAITLSALDAWREEARAQQYAERELRFDAPQLRTLHHPNDNLLLTFASEIDRDSISERSLQLIELPEPGTTKHPLRVASEAVSHSGDYVWSNKPGARRQLASELERLVECGYDTVDGTAAVTVKPHAPLRPATTYLLRVTNRLRTKSDIERPVMSLSGNTLVGNDGGDDDDDDDSESVNYDWSTQSQLFVFRTRPQQLLDVGSKNDEVYERERPFETVYYLTVDTTAKRCDDQLDRAGCPRQRAVETARAADATTSTSPPDRLAGWWTLKDVIADVQPGDADGAEPELEVVFSEAALGYGADERAALLQARADHPTALLVDDKSAINDDGTVTETHTDGTVVHHAAVAVKTNARLRQRGFTSRTAAYKSFQIKIDSSDESDEWREHRYVLVNKHPWDSTRARQLITAHLLKSMQDPDAIAASIGVELTDDERRQLRTVMSLRVKLARLMVDGVDYGFYTVTERLDPEYLRERGLDGDAQLYKATRNLWTFDDALRTPDDPDYDEAAFERVFEQKSERRNRDHDLLLELTAAVQSTDTLPDGSPRWPAWRIVQRFFERDNLLTWLAFAVLTDNRDTTSQNYFLYRPTDAGGFYILPWDFDGGFGWYLQAAVIEFNANVYYPGGEPQAQLGANNWIAGSALWRKFFADDELVAALEQRMQLLGRTVLSPAWIELVQSQFRSTLRAQLFDVRSSDDWTSVTVVADDADRQSVASIDRWALMLPSTDVATVRDAIESWEFEFDRLSTVSTFAAQNYAVQREHPWALSQSSHYSGDRNMLVIWADSRDMQGDEWGVRLAVSSDPRFEQRSATVVDTTSIGPWSDAVAPRERNNYALDASLFEDDVVYYVRLAYCDINESCCLSSSTVHLDGITYVGLSAARRLADGTWVSGE